MHSRTDFRQTPLSPDKLEAEWMVAMGHGGEPAQLAFDQLFLTYCKLFVRRLSKFGLLPQVAEEVAQDLWMEIAKAAPRYRPEQPVRFFLLGFLRMARRRHFQNLDRLPPLISASDEDSAGYVEKALQALSLSPREGWDFFDFARCVHRALAMLERENPRLVRLLLLKHVEELSMREIAQAEGGNENSVKVMVFSAREKFRPLAQHCQDLWPQR